jgi:hypothetical protein
VFAETGLTPTVVCAPACEPACESFGSLLLSATSPLRPPRVAPLLSATPSGVAPRRESPGGTFESKPPRLKPAS